MPPAGAAPLHHSYLYAPGSRPDVMDKALRAGADVVVCDLEDAVAPADKASARRAVAALLDDLAGRDPGDRPEVHVRINATDTGYDPADLAAVVSPALSALRPPKCAAPRHLGELADALDDLEATAGLPVGHVALYPLIESAEGIHRAVEVLRATPRVVRGCFGSSDLLADLGIPSEDPQATLFLRSKLVLDSRLAGVGPPIDSVHTDLADVDGLAAAARWARGLGFVGKSLIPPRQIAPTHAAFAPSEEEVARARAALAQADAGGSRQGDRFVDPAVIARAQSVLRLLRNQ